jgi:hypothetical protein
MTLVMFAMIGEINRKQLKVNRCLIGLGTENTFGFFENIVDCIDGSSPLLFDTSLSHGGQ